MARRALYVCARWACSEIFSRAPRDAGRARHPVCSLRCRDLMTSERVERVVLVCHGCGGRFALLPGVARKRAGRYCSRGCVARYVDFAELGRRGAAAQKRPVSDEARRQRSILGGRARARNLSAERLREIAMAGVRARLARPLSERRAWQRRAAATRSGQRSRFPGLFGRAPSVSGLRGKSRTVLLAGIAKED